MAVPALDRRGFALLAAALLARCAGADTDLSATDRADIARIQSALDALHGFRARFVQTASDRSVSSGTVWYDPGRLRLEYAPPARMQVVAVGRQLVAHRDADDATTRIALSGNPLGLLLAQPLRLSGPIRVTDVSRSPGILQASLTRTANPAQGLLTLIFADRAGGLELIGLEAVDQHGTRTRFRLFDAQSGLSLPAELFRPPGA